MRPPVVRYIARGYGANPPASSDAVRLVGKQKSRRDGQRRCARARSRHTLSSLVNQQQQQRWVCAMWNVACDMSSPLSSAWICHKHMPLAVSPRVPHPPVLLQHLWVRSRQILDKTPRQEEFSCAHVLQYTVHFRGLCKLSFHSPALAAPLLAHTRRGRAGFVPSSKKRQSKSFRTTRRCGGVGAHRKQGGKGFLQHQAPLSRWSFRPSHSTPATRRDTATWDKSFVEGDGDSARTDEYVGYIPLSMAISLSDSKLRHVDLSMSSSFAACLKIWSASARQLGCGAWHLFWFLRRCSSGAHWIEPGWVMILHRGRPGRAGAGPRRVCWERWINPGL